METLPVTALLTTKEVAQAFRLSPKRVRELAAEGVLRPVRLGATSRYRFRLADVERLISGETAP